MSKLLSEEIPAQNIINTRLQDQIDELRGQIEQLNRKN